MSTNAFGSIAAGAVTQVVAEDREDVLVQRYLVYVTAGSSRARVRPKRPWVAFASRSSPQEEQ